jgi:hypothetical protein
MNDDNQSICSSASTLSSAQVKTECPHCNKDFQTRALFNHMYSKHFRQFQQSISRTWLKEAEEGDPLRIWWEVKDDFDETKTIDLYACLGSKKTFMTRERAMLHFKKNKEDVGLLSDNYVKEVYNFSTISKTVFSTGCSISYRLYGDKLNIGVIYSEDLYSDGQIFETLFEKSIEEFKKVCD